MAVTAATRIKADYTSYGQRKYGAYCGHAEQGSAAGSASKEGLIAGCGGCGGGGCGDVDCYGSS